MKKDIYVELLRKAAKSFGWKVSDPSRREDWLRLDDLATELEEKGYSVKAVTDGIEHAKKVHPQYMPTNPMLFRCIQTEYEREKKNRMIEKMKGTKGDHFEWQQQMARCRQWNLEHHEDIIQDRVKPRFADPDIAFGKLKPE